jgi:hypothetical protein
VFNIIHTLIKTNVNKCCELSALGPGKEPSSAQWTGGCVGPRAGLEVWRREKSYPYREPKPGHYDSPNAESLWSKAIQIKESKLY